MRDHEAQQIIEMYERQWRGQPLGPAAALWKGYLLREDAVIATKALARLAETSHWRPELSDFAEVMATMRPPKEIEVECDTCRGDRFVVFALRMPVTTIWMAERGIAADTDEMIEEMAPCPECNADCDTEFSRGGGGRAKALDPALVRERMKS